MRSRVLGLVALLALSAVAAAGKLVNTFGFFIYPDSYYYLLVAENLANRGRILGSLGPGGMPFPPAGYAAAKVTYPLVVALLIKLGLATEAAGHWASIAAAVAAVPLAYIATRRLFGSTAAGLCAAAIMATSFGLTYWTGFVMSDSLSVALALGVLLLAAKRRDDEFTNAGDMATGAAVAFLLLSRPTYAAILPPLIWLCATEFDWTLRRLVTATVSGMFVVSFVAWAWFPPIGVTGSILLKVLPVLLGALLLGSAVVMAPGQLRRRTRKDEGSHDSTVPLQDQAPGGVSPRAVSVWGVGVRMAAAVFPFLWVLDWALHAAGYPYLYGGFARFGFRDPAALFALLPGAWYLSTRRQRPVAGALLAGALSLLAIYYWAEPRESRYLIHLLPLLVPVSAAAMLPVIETFVPRVRGHVRREPLRQLPAAALAVVLVASIGWQTARSLRGSTNSFLKTSYPREVASAIGDSLATSDRGRSRTFLISALPWPYYYHLRLPAWGIGVLKPSALSNMIPPNSEVVLLSDASLRFHFRKLADRIDALFARNKVFEGNVDSLYQYGYAVVPDRTEVRAYRLTCAKLATALFEAAPGRGGGTLRRR